MQTETRVNCFTPHALALLFSVWVAVAAYGQSNATAAPTIPQPVAVADSAPTPITGIPVVPKPQSKLQPAPAAQSASPVGTTSTAASMSTLTTTPAPPPVFAPAPPAATPLPKAAGAPSKLNEEKLGRLMQGFTALSRGDGGPDTLSTVLEYLSSAEIPGDDWVRFTGQYLQEAAFNQALAEELRRAVFQDGSGQQQAAQAIGSIVAAVLAAALQSNPPDYAAFDLALAWLDSLASFPVAQGIRVGLNGVFRNAPLDPAGLGAPEKSTIPPAANNPLHQLAPTSVGMESAAKPATTSPGAPSKEMTPAPGGIGPLAMQAAITLGNYAGPQDIGKWLRLTDGVKRIFEASGVWVFDSGMMAGPQAESLASLFSAFPASITGVPVVFAGTPPVPLRFSGQAITVAYYPPEAVRPPATLPPGAVLPPAPAFTAGVVTELARVVQQRELARNPLIAQRRDLLLRVAGSLPYSSLFAYLAAGDYTGNPDDFFPALALVWMAGSETVLQAAAALSSQNEHEPLYALLLLADLFSGGGDTTLLFAMNGDGKVVWQETALRRVMIMPDRVAVTGVAAGGGLIGYVGTNYEEMLMRP